jgi:hypothetical protein
MVCNSFLHQFINTLHTNNLISPSSYAGPGQSASIVRLTKEKLAINNEEETLKGVLIALKGTTANPSLMDFITIYPTLPGFKAYRLKVENEYESSFFIQALCETLSEEYLNEKKNYFNPGENKGSGKDPQKCPVKNERNFKRNRNAVKGRPAAKHQWTSRKKTRVANYVMGSMPE